MYHLVVASPYDERCHDMAGISRRLGYDFVLLSRVNHATGIEPYGHIHKITLSLRELKKNQLIRDNIIMFTDAYDVLPLLPARVIEARFRNLDCDFCFSTEANFHPGQQHSHPHSQLGVAYRDDVKAFYETKGEGQHLYPNGGGWIGYGWAVEKILEAACKYSEEYGIYDDQQIYQDIEYFSLVEGVRFKTDFKQKIFTSILGNVHNLRMAGSGIFSQETEWDCGLIHFNGHAGAWRDFIGFYNKVFHESWVGSCHLNVLKSDSGSYICEEGDIFVESADICHNIIFSIVSPSANFVLMTAQGRLGTLNPHSLMVSFSFCPLNAWEVQSGSTVIDLISERVGCRVRTDFVRIEEIVESGLFQRGEQIKTYFNMMV